MTSPEPDLAVFVAETRTGRVLWNGIPISSVPRAGYRINTEGSLAFSVPMSAAFSKTQIVDFLYPWKYSFGVRFGSFIIQYGPLVTHPSYDAEAETWEFTCAGLWKFFNTKRILRVTKDCTGLSSNDIFRKLLADDLAQTNGDLPVDLPGNNGLGGVGQVFEGAKISYIGELLRDQTDDGNNPLECEFRPYFPDTTVMDYVRHRVDLKPYLGTQTRAYQWTNNQGSLIVAAPEGGGDRIADIYIVPGQSSGADLRYGLQQAVGGDALAAQGWPLMYDLDGTHSSVSDQVVLQGYANGNWIAFHNGPRTISARVRINPPEGRGPRIGEWTLGDLGRFQVAGYLGVPDGAYVARILGVDLVSLEDIELELMLISEVLA